jgi:hypothetical protein
MLAQAVIYRTENGRDLAAIVTAVENAEDQIVTLSVFGVGDGDEPVKRVRGVKRYPHMAEEDASGVPGGTWRFPAGAG